MGNRLDFHAAAAPPRHARRIPCLHSITKVRRTSIPQSTIKLIWSDPAQQSLRRKLAGPTGVALRSRVRTTYGCTRRFLHAW